MESDTTNAPRALLLRFAVTRYVPCTPDRYDVEAAYSMNQEGDLSLPSVTLPRFLPKTIRESQGED